MVNKNRKVLIILSIKDKYNRQMENRYASSTYKELLIATIKEFSKLTLSEINDVFERMKIVILVQDIKYNEIQKTKYNSNIQITYKKDSIYLSKFIEHILRHFLTYGLLKKMIIEEKEFEYE